MILDEAKCAIYMVRYMLENLVYTCIVRSLNCLDLNYGNIFFYGFFSAVKFKLVKLKYACFFIATTRIWYEYGNEIPF